jgi:hypothetical protein
VIGCRSSADCCSARISFWLLPPPTPLITRLLDHTTGNPLADSYLDLSIYR